ncbi:hypothetical protein HOK51_08845 [Candidatus Woesearchaeota archaeon]|jgi:hypothetical protein|nr:hypothetical protein [Candidatus Woesearchaeota archaeon]MBT6519935.1 hypothetical protein [Candidatus Woesearchaeota archaeon]MBT7367089.1 hypothetical protein [Candidatus Woesearchaeota archaeon]
MRFLKKKKVLDEQSIEEKQEVVNDSGNVYLVPKGCPICRKDLKGNDQVKYFCEKCNVLFDRKDIRSYEDRIKDVEEEKKSKQEKEDRELNEAKEESLEQIRNAVEEKITKSEQDDVSKEETSTEKQKAESVDEKEQQLEKPKEQQLEKSKEKPKEQEMQKPIVQSEKSNVQPKKPIVQSEKSVDTEDELMQALGMSDSKKNVEQDVKKDPEPAPRQSQSEEKQVEEKTVEEKQVEKPTQKTKTKSKGEFTLETQEKVIASSESKKIHAGNCHFVSMIQPNNRIYFDSIEEGEKKGYELCVCLRRLKAIMRAKAKE